MIPELRMLKHHFGGGLPQITVASFLLGWVGFFLCVFQFVLLHFWNHHESHSFVYRTESGKVDLLGKRTKLGGGRGQFYSGYFHFIFPHEETGFSLTFSYHSENNSIFCHCHLKNQKECIHQKNQNLLERGVSILPKFLEACSLHVEYCSYIINP